MSVPVLLLGGTGYVAGELLRLLAGHPELRLAAVSSEKQAGEAVAAAFPHLAAAYPELTFVGREALAAEVARHPRLALLSAAPHGAAAGVIAELLARAEAAGSALTVVDVSADFRFRDAAAYAAVYGHPHPAPERLAEFSCAVPEHLAGTPTPHAAHPGCFTTATLLAAVPLLALGLVEPELTVVAVTGSTGAGRSLGATTHHPARRSNLFAYSPLAHRHEPEMRALAQAATGVAAEIFFVPQAGPLARGIYATVTGRLRQPLPAAEVRQALAEFYAGSPFVAVEAGAPQLSTVAGSNLACLGVAVSGHRVVVLSAIDNLVKGAAGGALQWLNRLLGFPEALGLAAPGPGWL